QTFISDKTPQEKAVEWVHLLDCGVLPIQGPPGAGKSHTAANMILSLIKTGKKIGITALSHKVVDGLMEKVAKVAEGEGIFLQCVKKVSELPEKENPHFRSVKDNKK